MFLKNMKPLANLAKKARGFNNGTNRYRPCNKKSSLLEDSIGAPLAKGFFAVYVGEEIERFVVPTRFLSHPLFKILLEKAGDEFGYEQSDRLIVPCSVAAFREVFDAVVNNHGAFDMSNFIEELIV